MLISQQADRGHANTLCSVSVCAGIWDSYQAVVCMYVCFSGDEEKVLLGSEKGEVMMVHNGDLRVNIAVDAEAAINAIVPTSKVCSSR